MFNLHELTLQAVANNTAAENMELYKEAVESKKGSFKAIQDVINSIIESNSQIEKVFGPAKKKHTILTLTVSSDEADEKRAQEKINEVGKELKDYISTATKSIEQAQKFLFKGDSQKNVEARTALAKVLDAFKETQNKFQETVSQIKDQFEVIAKIEAKTKENSKEGSVEKQKKDNDPSSSSSMQIEASSSSTQSLQVAPSLPLAPVKTPLELCIDNLVKINQLPSFTEYMEFIKRLSGPDVPKSVNAREPLYVPQEKYLNDPKIQAALEDLYNIDCRRVYRPVIFCRLGILFNYDHQMRSLIDNARVLSMNFIGKKTFNNQIYFDIEQLISFDSSHRLLSFYMSLSFRLDIVEDEESVSMLPYKAANPQEYFPIQNLFVKEDFGKFVECWDDYMTRAIQNSTLLYDTFCKIGKSVNVEKQKSETKDLLKSLRNIQHAFYEETNNEKCQVQNSATVVGFIKQREKELDIEELAAMKNKELEHPSAPPKDLAFGANPPGGPPAYNDLFPNT